MILGSILAGILGLLGTWLGMAYLQRPGSPRPPEVFWVFGMAAIFPAWLIAILGLLGRVSGRFPEMSIAVWWILSAAAAIAGVILADAMVRRIHQSGQPAPPVKCWLIGVGTFIPAWGLALLGLL